MPQIIGRLDEWAEARPWLAAVCAGLVVAAILTTITLVLDDTPNWLLLVGLTLTTTLSLGFKRQAQRRRRQDAELGPRPGRERPERLGLPQPQQP
jgi:hypothetical protein